MAKQTMAWRTGMFRCSGVHQTIFANAGDILASCDDCVGECKWEFKDTDNPDPKRTYVFINVGIFHAIFVREVPQKDVIINLRGGIIREGRYRVTKVDRIDWRGFFYPCIEVDRLGDIGAEGSVYRSFVIS